MTIERVLARCCQIYRNDPSLANFEAVLIAFCRTSLRDLDVETYGLKNAVD